MGPPLYTSSQLTMNDILMELILHSYFTILLAKHGETIRVFKHGSISELCKYLQNGKIKAPFLYKFTLSISNKKG